MTGVFSFILKLFFYLHLLKKNNISILIVCYEKTQLKKNIRLECKR